MRGGPEFQSSFMEANIHVYMHYIRYPVRPSRARTIYILRGARSLPCVIKCCVRALDRSLLKNATTTKIRVTHGAQRHSRDDKGAVNRNNEHAQRMNNE